MTSMDALCRRFKRGGYTPFVGAAVSSSVISLAHPIVKRWKKHHELPVAENSDLKHVAQLIAADDKLASPHADLAEEIEDKQKGLSDEQIGWHMQIADVRSEIFFTTNYDDLIEQALLKNGRRPKRIVPPWNSQLRNKSERFDFGMSPTKQGIYYLHGEISEFAKASEEEPWVVHLHGHFRESNSMVLTEDDYTEFLLELRKQQNFIHHFIERYLAEELFMLGYSLADETFRVMLRAILREYAAKEPRNITLQLPKENFTEEFARDRDPAERYRELFERYFGVLSFGVCWSNLSDFMPVLKQAGGGYRGLEA